MGNRVNEDLKERAKVEDMNSIESIDELNEESSASTIEIKSTERKKEYGEVYTPEHIVKAMCDLVDDELHRIDSKVLEPSCGNGNFLVEIMQRKMQECYNEIDIINAVGSVYGIDIMPDNIDESRERVLKVVSKRVMELGLESKELRAAIEYIVSLNIVLGNTLTNKALQTYSKRASGKISNVTMEAGELCFIEWRVIGNKVKPIKFSLEHPDIELSDYGLVGISDIVGCIKEASDGYDDYDDIL